jgi:hypothetical protein
MTKYEQFYATVEARAEKATPGPWTFLYTDSYTECERIITSDGDRPRTEADGDFLVHARTDVPALVARCRALTKALEELCDDFSETHRLSYEEARAVLDAVPKETK